jgi:hypothetical protein
MRAFPMLRSVMPARSAPAAAAANPADAHAPKGFAGPTAPPAAAPAPERRTKPERRSASRIQVKGLLCDRGQIVDLSARGLRMVVHRRWPEGASRTLTIVDTPHSIPVTARCVWCRQQSMFSHIVGLAFENLTQDQVEALLRMAQRHEHAGTPSD